MPPFAVSASLPSSSANGLHTVSNQYPLPTLSRILRFMCIFISFDNRKGDRLLCFELAISPFSISLPRLMTAVSRAREDVGRCLFLRSLVGVGLVGGSRTDMAEVSSSAPFFFFFFLPSAFFFLTESSAFHSRFNFARFVSGEMAT